MRTLMICGAGLLAVVMGWSGVHVYAAQADRVVQAAQAGQATQYVRFMASVVDGSGATVTNLDIDDVSVSAGDRPWPIVGFEPIAWPTKVVIAVDNGTNMRGAIGDLRTGLKAMIRELPAGVEITLQTTAPQPRTIQAATTDKGALLKAVDLIAPDDGSPHFIDALAEAAQRFDGEAEIARGGVFPVVVVVGTTGVEGSSYNESHLVRMMRSLQRRSATVHVVMLNTGAVSEGENQTNIAINATKLTGGRYASINSAGRLRTLLPELGKQVARSATLQEHQYLIVVQRPENQKGPVGDLKVASKAGYRMRLSRDGHMP